MRPYGPGAEGRKGARRVDAFVGWASGYLSPQNSRAFEGYHLPRVETHRLTGLGVAALARLFVPDHEFAEAANQNWGFGAQGLLYYVDNALDMLAGLKGCDLHLITYARDDSLFGHGHR